MQPAQEHILAADVGGTHIGLAIFAHHGGSNFSLVRHKTHLSRSVSGFPALLKDFLVKEGRRLVPRVRKACVAVAGPVGPDRSEATVTNLGWGFTAAEITESTGIKDLTLLNDFEAIGFGLEILIANKPEAFVRLSRTGRLPRRKGRKPTVAVIGAGTGLGTCILIHDSKSGLYRPVPGEGGHADFVAIDEDEFRIAQWIRKHQNRSSRQPLECEKIVSGPGLVNVYRALSELEPHLGNPAHIKRVFKADPYDRPAVIVRNVTKDPLARRALDTWLRCYARVAKNSAIFPLSPGGVFLAGGVAAKILPEMKSGVFMEEFIRCDVPNMQLMLKRTPVFVVTDYSIGLHGCANVAVNGELVA